MRTGAACRRAWKKAIEAQKQEETRRRQAVASRARAEARKMNREEDGPTFSAEEEVEMLRLNDLAPYGRYRTIAQAMGRDWRDVRARLEEL